MSLDQPYAVGHAAVASSDDRSTVSPRIQRWNTRESVLGALGEMCPYPHPAMSSNAIEEAMRLVRSMCARLGISSLFASALFKGRRCYHVLPLAREKG
jgi:hypothetical protein